ncbi:MAG: thymidylate synthase [Tissierellia bacterium]|nr:thymidylate synthase [Tissierellia bacterium]
MSRIDEIFIEKSNEILNEGYSERDAKNNSVRPVWNDEESAYTIYLPQQFVTYKEGEVPITNLRKIAWKTAIKELLWIYKDRCNNVNNLREKYNVKYWDSWANEEGSLGTAYGYQTSKTFKSPETGKWVNQVTRLIEQLRDNPLNRRLIITLYDVDDLAEMTLIPCAFMTMWTVVGDKLNMTLIQRSGDFLAAAGPGGINSFQYYVLMRMIAQVTGYKPGEMVHFVQNLHIYDKHIPLVKEVAEKDATKKGPELWINPDIKEFDDFTIDDFRLLDYNPDTQSYDIPIAL